MYSCFLQPPSPTTASAASTRAAIPRGYIELEGTLTGLDFVNPHSYVHFDAVGDDGAVMAMSCEMRGASVLRRSGWSPDMIVPGVAIAITGRPNRSSAPSALCACRPAN